MVIKLLLCIPILILLSDAITGFKTGWKRQKQAMNESTPGNIEKPLESEIEPFTDDLIELYDNQSSILEKQIELLNEQIHNETNTTKQAALYNKLAIAQKKLIKIKQIQYKLWKSSD